VLVCASVLWLVLPTRAGAGAASAAVVRHGGEVVARLPLDRPGARTFCFEAGRITVEVVPGKGVCISESNCPEKICVHAGWISRPGETIACLPNKLLVEIEGENQEYDAVTY
ncbi:MAG: NusG domain II-containing protein, partial [Elusimicrobia bacterium]|nr:NusG domain II-containing protein [Elusimicrobiota bacterium]